MKSVEFEETKPEETSEDSSSCSSNNNINNATHTPPISETFQFTPHLKEDNRMAAAPANSKVFSQTHQRKCLNRRSKRRNHQHFQHFLALSSVLPYSNKMDKASILDDAINYLKKLQNKANMLEKQTKTNKSLEEDFPEIEATAQEKNVLIRIHSQKHQGLPTQVLSQLEKLHLNIINFCALPFGDYFLDITIVAQMGNKFCMTMNDLKENLRLALAEFMSFSDG